MPRYRPECRGELRDEVMSFAGRSSRPRIELWSGSAPWRSRGLRVFLIALVAPVMAARGEGVGAGFQEVVVFHMNRYPAMEIEDLYKLVFQAAMGSEHAVASVESARQWLERELSTLHGVSDEPSSEPLSPDGSLVRVNLRARIERGGRMDDLLDAFVQTANQFEGSPEKLRAYWGEVGEMVVARAIPFQKSALDAFFAEMEAQGFPAVHHSTTYREKYHPAYRVVLRELLEANAAQRTGQ
jgi:hypothetical protein